MISIALWWHRLTRSRPLRLLMLSVLVILPLIFLGTAWIIGDLRDAALAAAEQQLGKISRVIGLQSNRSFANVDLVLSRIADELRAAGIDTVEAYRSQESDAATSLMLKRHLAGLPQLDAITMIDASGKLINFSRFFPVPDIDVRDRDYFQVLSQDSSTQRFISAPVQNRATGSWTIYLARRLEGKDHQFIGLILGAINVDYFSLLYRDSALDPQDAVSLVRDDGMLVARWPENASIGRFITPPGRSAGQLLSVVLRKIGDIDHQPDIIARYGLQDYPLTVNLIRSQAEVLAEWRPLAFVVTVAGGVAMISVLLSAIMLARQFLSYEALGRALAQRAEAEALSAAKSQFLANMSHELRTPLNAIIGFSEVLDQEMFGPLIVPKYREYVADILRSGRHLLSIVNDILDFSAFQAAKISLDRQDVDLAALLGSAVTMLRDQADRAGLTLTLAVPVALPPFQTDARRMLQILVNIVSNAIKFTPEGGSIAITLARSSEGVTISIRDSGIGVAAEDLDRIMTPFGQVETGFARRHPGTGLGLPLAKGLTEALGGHLHLVSAPGLGTEVTLSFPVSPVSEPPSQPNAEIL